MLVAPRNNYELPRSDFDHREEASLNIFSTRLKVTLVACSVILLLGTAYHVLTGCDAYYCRPIPPCEPSFCKEHQFEKILGGSCYCPG